MQTRDMSLARLSVTAAVILVTILGSNLASAQSARVLTRGEVTQIVLAMPVPDHPVVPPIWSGHALLNLIVNETRTPVIDSITADGLTEEVRFSIPDWTRITVAGLWGGEDGEIVAGGFGVTGQIELKGFVVRIARDRTQQTVIPVENLLIRAMTVGPSGVIWAMGSGKDQETGDVHQNILTRLSPTGKVLSSTMLDLPGKPSYTVARPTSMRASTDRVAWVTERNDYVEFGTDGTEMTHIAGPPKSPNDMYNTMFGTAFALSYANTALISKVVTSKAVRGKKPSNPTTLQIWTLDRVKQNWFLSESANGAFPTSTSIFGFDGETLVTSEGGHQLVRYALSETK
jgi:hypothetical protein